MAATPITAPLTIDDIESRAVGAWILGTGGGGPYLGTLLKLPQLRGMLRPYRHAIRLGDAAMGSSARLPQFAVRVRRNPCSALREII